MIPKKIKKLIKVARKYDLRDFSKDIKGVTYSYHSYKTLNGVTEDLSTYTHTEIRKEIKI